MQLTCPTCRSGLEVPDGTTAHVRCPACRTVFSAAAGLAPPAPVLPPPVPVPVPPLPRPPRPSPPPPAKEKDPHPDVDIPDVPEGPAKRRRRTDYKLTPEEKRKQRAAFGRAFYGAKLIQLSLFFYIPAVLFVPLHQIVAEITKNDVPYVLVIACILGFVNWILGAIGISLCLPGPPLPGHFRFGIAAIITSIVQIRSSPSSPVSRS